MSKEQKHFDALVQEAIRVRYAVYQAGGMATKSGIEDVLMHMFGIDRGLGHLVMNHIEQHDLDSFRFWHSEGPEPTLEDYPFISLDGRLRRIKVVGERQ